MHPLFLGLHGLLPDTQARGVHDASFCIFDPVANELLALIEMEKISGSRHEANLDQRMLESAMEEFPDREWDLITSHFSPLDSRPPTAFPLFRDMDSLYGRRLKYCSKGKRVFLGKECSHYIYLHELAHVFSAFMYREKDREEFLGLVVEGSGSFAQSALFRIAGFRVYLLEYNLAVLSGHFFQKWLPWILFGIDRNDYPGRASTPGKVMAMAAYGDPDRFYPALKKAVLKYHPSEFVNYKEGFCPEIESLHMSWQDRLDLAASGQRLFEDLLEEEGLRIRAKYGDLPLYYGGGCALSVKANSRLHRIFEEIVIPPNCADDGQSLGLVALHAFTQYGQYLPPLSPAASLCGPLGPSCSLPGKLTQEGLDTVVSWLEQGQVVAFAQGRPEVGPRALCRRSLLASPGDAKMKDALNHIKEREYFRPVAPIVLHPEGRHYFEGYFFSPYMLYDFPVRPEWKDRIPAAVHEDGTARVQSIPDDGSDISLILKAFANRTGHPPILLNTSLNSRGRPIAASAFQILGELPRLRINRCVLGGEAMDHFDDHDLRLIAEVGKCGIGARRIKKGWRFTSWEGRFSPFFTMAECVFYEFGEGEMMFGQFKAFFRDTYMRLLFGDGSVFLVYPSGHIRWMPRGSYEYFSLLSQGLPPLFCQGDLVVFGHVEMDSRLISTLEGRLPPEQGSWWCYAAPAAPIAKKWHEAREVMLGGNERHKAFGRLRFRAPISRDFRTLELNTLDAVSLRHNPTDAIHPVIELLKGEYYLVTKLPGFSDPAREMKPAKNESYELSERLR